MNTTANTTLTTNPIVPTEPPKTFVNMTTNRSTTIPGTNYSTGLINKDRDNLNRRLFEEKLPMESFEVEYRVNIRGKMDWEEEWKNVSKGELGMSGDRSLIHIECKKVRVISTNIRRIRRTVDFSYWLKCRSSNTATTMCI